MTRRGLLAAVAGLAATPARAATPPRQPVSKEEAQYQAAPRGMFSCSICTLFIKPRSCKVVSGDVSPYGWCKYFDMPD